MISSSPAGETREQREAVAIAILGKYEGEDLAAWIADITRAGIESSNDPRRESGDLFS